MLSTKFVLQTTRPKHWSWSNHEIMSPKQATENANADGLVNDRLLVLLLAQTLLLADFAVDRHTKDSE